MPTKDLKKISVSSKPIRNLRDAYFGFKGYSPAEKLLAQLFIIGAYDDKSKKYELQVDGVIGKNTKAAIEKAKLMGYNVNVSTGNITRKLETNNSTNTSLSNTKFSLLEDSVFEGIKGLWNTVSRLGRKADKYYIPWTPKFQSGESCGTDLCALYANDSLRNYKDAKGRALYTYDNIGGDAWTRLSSGKDSKMIYSGYDGMDYDTSNEVDLNNYKLYLEAVNKDNKSAEKYRDLLQRSVGNLSRKRNAEAADNLYRNFDSKTLDKNKTYLVNMYYNTSPNMGVAWYGATNGTTGTHTGNLYWNPKTNSWRISHNIHGIVHDDDFIQAQGSRNKFGYGVTAIAEAPRKVYYDYKQGGLINKYKISGKFIDFVNHPVLHTRSIITGLFPSKKDYKNTIYINKNNQRLHYYDENGNLVVNSPVSTGAIPGNKTKQGDLKTPEGNFRISYSTNKADKNKFGDTLFYGLSYGSGIGIHGDAGNPNAIGRRASHGCIRMPNGLLRCLEEYIGNGVGTKVIIEKLGGNIQKFQTSGTIKLPTMTVTSINPNRFEKDSPAYQFTMALNNNRNMLMNRYNLTDKEYSDLANFAINIALRESSLGEGKSYNFRGSLPESGIRLSKGIYRGLIKGKGFSNQYNAPLSRGLTQIKYGLDIADPYLSKEYKELGITDENLSSDYNSMAKATIARALHIRNFLNSKKGVNNYHYSDGRIIPADSAMAMYWNRGRLTDYANPHPDNLDAGGATGYVRRYEHQKIIK